MKKIEAKVATVLTDYELALTAGTGAGVETGASVVISKRVDVLHPDTNEPLGVVQVPRVRLQVTGVEDHFCLAKVVDRVPSGQTFGELFGTVGKSKPSLKTLIEGRGEDTDSAVYVVPGDAATITVTEESDVPF